MHIYNHQIELFLNHPTGILLSVINTLMRNCLEFEIQAKHKND